MGTVAFIAVYFLMLGYPGIRLGTALIPGWQPGTVTLLVLWVLPALLWLSYRWENTVLTRWCARAAYTWIGVAFVALLATVPWELLVWATGIGAPVSGYILLTVLLTTWAWGLRNAQVLSVKRVTISSPKITRPLRLVHISDVHIGSRSPAFLARVVARINQLDADAVAITGDLVDFHGICEQYLAPLSKLTAPAYFCTGNHERYVDCDALCKRIGTTGVTVLRNAQTTGNALCWVGIDDAEDHSQISSVLPNITLPTGLFTILLYHKPDDFEAAVRGGIDLMLCGHTHNGQIKPFNLLVKKRFPRIAGLHEHGGAKLYVSPGTGTWGPPLRLGSVNEITLIELTRA